MISRILIGVYLLTVINARYLLIDLQEDGDWNPDEAPIPDIGNSPEHSGMFRQIITPVRMTGKQSQTELWSI